ncbi:hypothetical protein OPV22_008967 [Ensete ventricosum]|uniref:Uncharacterized protein n=1 Tax=Ensete ventricosum TaxID=4639 RepID=A0AAV8PQ83_ENSVE|nr:hypothetical protein OPV22_008967 [Ensete ventricosum]
MKGKPTGFKGGVVVPDRLQLDVSVGGIPSPHQNRPSSYLELGPTAKTVRSIPFPFHCLFHLQAGGSSRSVLFTSEGRPIWWFFGAIRSQRGKLSIGVHAVR